MHQFPKKYFFIHTDPIFIIINKSYLSLNFKKIILGNNNFLYYI